MSEAAPPYLRPLPRPLPRLQGTPLLYGFVPFLIDDRERAKAAGPKMGLLLLDLAKEVGAAVRARGMPSAPPPL